MPIYTLDDTGLTISDWLTIHEEVLKAYQGDVESGGFGATADVSPDSPFYKVASPLTRQVSSLLQGLRDLTGQFSPETAFGLQLDRLGSLIGLPRRPAVRSTVEARVTGTPGVQPFAGATLRYLPTGSMWQLAEDVTIGLNGIAPANAFALDFGPVDVPMAGPGLWQIVTGQVLGWDTFESTAAASLGRLRETDPEYRQRFRDVAVGYATYDAIVNKLRAVRNVSRVFLYVNKALLFDPVLQLQGKQMRPVVEGGLKSDIITALHLSLGAPVDTAGAIEGTVDPGNGQTLDYHYDRLKRRRCYLKLTITGGNPNAPLPDGAEDIVLEAVDAIESNVGPFVPYIYGQAAAIALQNVTPGCITKMVAEGRLDPGDPWVEDAIPLEIAEYADVSVAPTPAVAVADNDNPSIALGFQFTASIDGGPIQAVVWPVATVGSAAAAAVLDDPLTGLDDVSVDVVNGRVTITTLSSGGTSTIQLLGGFATAELFDNPNALYEGSDADVTVVLIP